MPKAKRNREPALYVIGGEKLLPVNKFHLNKITPKTNNQDRAFRLHSEGFNLVLAGSAGVGKSFLAMYLALADVMDSTTPYDRVVIVRSTVPTRNQGFLPGGILEKQQVYEMPYKGIARELICPSITGDVYEKLKAQKSLEFISTSFIRGITIDNAIIVVDEFANLNFHELDSIITRVGQNCKIIFCGDTRQSDLLHNDKLEHVRFLEILDEMGMFRSIHFGVEDIVRSSMVKQYLTVKDRLGY
jgi:phosphate starvation-inducible protein PhoH and related proteins